MILDGGPIYCLEKFHSIKLNMGKYLVYSPIITNQMHGIDVVLWFQWLESLGIVVLNFHDIFLKRQGK